MREYIGEYDGGESISQLHDSIYEPHTFKPISEFHLHSSNQVEEHKGECDPDTDYGLNSNYFRSPELGLVDLVTLGCSQTFGMGVDDDDIWPHRLAQTLNCSYVNLAMPGSAIETMVSSAFAYIQEYGKPKVIAALLPGYGRMQIPLNNKHFTFRDNRDKRDLIFMNNLNFGYREDGGPQDVPLISKRPHVIDELLPYEVALHQSMFALSVLIQYCKDVGIELVFSTWNGAMNDFIEKKKQHHMTKLDLSGYVKVPPVKWQPKHQACHTELIKNESIWDVARDCGGHIGVHSHIHYAEAFAEKIEML